GAQTLNSNSPFGSFTTAMPSTRGHGRFSIDFRDSELTTMESKSATAALLAFALLALLCRQVVAAPYDPPASYYNSATGTGSTLKSQLRTITSNMRHVSYGDARYSAPYTDADPNKPGNILLIYNR